MKTIKTSELLNMSEKTISAIIKRLRLIHGFTQTELGAKIGVSFQQIQKYERGKDNIPIPRLRDIAKVFNIHISEFFPKQENTEEPLEVKFTLQEVMDRLLNMLKNN